MISTHNCMGTITWLMKYLASSVMLCNNKIKLMATY